MRKLILVPTVLALILSVLPVPAKTNANCTDVFILFARGSGQIQDDIQSQKPTYKFFDEITSRKPANISVTKQELIYPAQGGIFEIGDAKFPFLKPIANYGGSKEAGISNALTTLRRQIRTCPSQKFVLGGYSQGADVIGEALFSLSGVEAEKIVYIGLFGDPKFKPDSYSSTGTFTSKRGGVLGPRKLDFPASYIGKIQSWCRKFDGICENDISRLKGEKSEHPKYPDQEIPIAANFAARLLKQHFSEFNTKHIRPGSLGEKADIVFAVSSAANMRYPIQDMQANIASLANNAMQLSKDTRVGLAQFNNVKFGCGIKQPRNDLLLSNNSISFIARFNDLFGACGSGTDDTLGGLMTAINEQPWRDDARKVIILLDCNRPNDPEEISGVNSSQVINAARKKNIEIDAVIRGNLLTQQSYYSTFTNATGGQSVFMPAGTTGDAIQMAKFVNQMYVRLGDAPIAKLAEQRPSRPGNTVSFNAGGSYDPDGAIISYEWDFNNDNIVDTTTTSPIVSYTYSLNYTGLATVKVVSSDGGQSVASTQMSIDDNNPTYLKPDAPINVVAMLSGESNATLSWQVSGKGVGAMSIEVPPTDEYVIRNTDGEVLGIVDGNIREVTIENLPEDQSISFSVEATNSEGSSNGSNSNIINVSSPTPDEPAESTPNNSWPNNSTNSNSRSNGLASTDNQNILSEGGNHDDNLQNVHTLNTIYNIQSMKNFRLLELLGIQLQKNEAPNLLWLLIPMISLLAIYIYRQINKHKSTKLVG